MKLIRRSVLGEDVVCYVCVAVMYSDELQFECEFVCIRESVDSLCRDGADAQYLSKSRITSPQTRKKLIASRLPL